MAANEITVHELAALRAEAKPHVLLDVREDDELVTAAVSGALHIPMKMVPQRMAELPTEIPLVVMCHHGGRSARVTAFLRQNGRTNAVNLEGGIDMWATAVDSTVPRY
jgi:rhodanese-related sulfurtransferase